MIRRLVLFSVLLAVVAWLGVGPTPRAAQSALDVDGTAEAVKSERGDGRIDNGALQFAPRFPDLNRTAAGRLEVSFHAAAGDVQKVFLLVKGGDSGNSLSMVPVGIDAAGEIWRLVLPLREGLTRLSFEFKVADGQAAVFVDRGGASAAGRDDPFQIYLSDLPVFQTPAWVAEGIFYQIFPDRFSNGDTKNDPDFSESCYAGLNALPAGGRTDGEYYHLVTDWNDYGGLTQSPFRMDGRPDFHSFYGGDIEGVRQKLDYLFDLGVNIITLNPITKGKSNDKYDAGDYMMVDPHFGSQAEFLRFVNEAHAKGIRVVVEAVFDHCGDTHWAFVDSRDKGRESEYWNWFEWKKWPLPETRDFEASDYYECRQGFGLYPDLNFDLSRTDSQESGVKDIADAEVNRPLVKHLLEVSRFWLEDMDVDGFRLDVPDDVPFWFWKLFRDKVKSIKPDAYLVGELRDFAPDLIGPEYFDATMNDKYFRDPVARWIGQGKGDAADFERDMSAGRTAYPSQAVSAMMNIVDSHDTVRFITLAGGDRRRLQLAALLAMTYVGAPHIWYGDEIGMEGEDGPDCRRPYYWNYAEDPKRVALRDYYKKLTAARSEHGALRHGAFRLVAAEGQTYAFLREDGSDRLITVIHNGGKPARVDLDLAALGAPDGIAFRFLVGGADPAGEIRVKVAGGKLSLDMGPLAGALLIGE